METETVDRPVNPFGSAPIAAAPTGVIAAAAVQREVAEVQAAMVIAKRFPRDPIQAMDRIMNACTRPTLAEAALYQYSRGGQDIAGASIRLAEQLARDWGNIVCGVTELARQDGHSECLSYAWDLETNFRDEKRFTVRHWRDTKKGGYRITDERDVYELIANMGARRKRACILAVIPGDVQETAVRQCEATMKAKIEITPEFIQSVIDGFEPFGVMKEHLEKRIQRRIDTMTPGLAVQLKKIHNSLKDGMSVAADWFEIEAAAEPADGEPKTGTAGVKDALRKQRQPTPQQNGKPDAAKPGPSDDSTLMQDVMSSIEKALAITDREIAMLQLDDAERMAGELGKANAASAKKAIATAKEEISQRMAK